MYEIETIFRFEAGHVLTHHDGICARPHGHSYVLTVRLQGNKLTAEGPKTNMVVDFHDVKKVVKKMIDDHLDHHWLNDTLESDSPTAEYIATWIYDHLKPQLPLLYSVSLNETATSKVTYFGAK